MIRRYSRGSRFEVRNGKESFERIFIVCYLLEVISYIYCILK